MSTGQVRLPLDGSPGELVLTPYSGEAIREGGRYAFRAQGTAARLRTIEPAELFLRRPDDPAAGDFLPRQCVGTVGIVCGFVDGSVGRAAVEVHPAHLDLETEYHRMLEQLADHAAEAVLQGFAPASLQVGIDPSQEAALAYGQLAYVAARLRDPSFQAALVQVRRQPHEGWATHDEDRPTARGAPRSARLADAARRPGRARPTPPGHGWPAPTMPTALAAERVERTFDTPPNRFARHALARWQAVALDVLSTLRSTDDLGAGPRGRAEQEATWVAETCDDLLTSSPLRDVGRLTFVPTTDQALLRRAGYRELLRAFALTEAATALHAELPDDVFSATQRNVATLYEYWCFAVLVRAMSELAGAEPSSVLFEPSPAGMRLVLRQGEASRLAWELAVDGRSMTAELWFNRTFSSGGVPGADASWARRLRPDASLRLRPTNARPADVADPELDVWVHFDAKYRLAPLLGAGSGSEGPSGGAGHTALHDDLLKMHAYRDGIRRSSGAYVLYPGDAGPELRREFHEVLPGLGAFPLRPSPDGDAAGASALGRFLRDVTRHVADQASARERTQYWAGRHATTANRRVTPVDVLPRPPADTLTLLGYARQAQVPWVRERLRYNVRVGDRRGAVSLEDEVLAADLVVVWTGSGRDRRVVGAFARTGAWQVALLDDPLMAGYPATAPDARYLVTDLTPLPEAVRRSIRPEALSRHLHPITGRPVAVTWDLLEA